MAKDRKDWTCEPGPAAGSAPAGKAVNPKDPPDEEAKQVKRPAPSPGTPVSDEEYERLKEDAKRRPPPDDVPAQED